MASIQNLASGVLASDISSSATSLGVNCGEGSSSTLTAVWPSAPFYITVMPAYPALGVANSLNSEIMLVSALSASDNVVTMTVSRGQRGTTAKAFSEGAIITNGIYTADMDYAQAVGRSFFSATLTNSITGSYTVSDSMLPNTPEDGMSIRVVFGGIQEDTTFTPKLRLNSGSYYNVYAGNNLRSDAGTATGAMVKSGVIYELTYYNGAWYVLNLVASSSIVSDNIDFTTISGQALSDLMTSIVKTIYWTGPYACVSKIERIGNLVIYDMYATPSNFPTHGESQEKIPVGYRPSDYTHCVFRSSFNQAGLWQINPSGTVSWWMGTANPGDIQAHCAYHTNDAYPSSTSG